MLGFRNPGQFSYLSKPHHHKRMEKACEYDKDIYETYVEAGT